MTGQDVLYNASIGSYSKTLGTHFLQYDPPAAATPRPGDTVTSVRSRRRSRGPKALRLPDFDSAVMGIPPHNHRAKRRSYLLHRSLTVSREMGDTMQLHNLSHRRLISAACLACAAALMPAGASAITAAASATAAGSPGCAHPVTAYVASADSGTVTPIRTATNHALNAIKVAFSANAIAITPNGKTAYVVNENAVGGPGPRCSRSRPATNTAGSCR